MSRRLKWAAHWQRRARQTAGCFHKAPSSCATRTAPSSACSEAEAAPSPSRLPFHQRVPNLTKVSLGGRLDLRGGGCRLAEAVHRFYQQENGKGRDQEGDDGVQE